MVVYLDAVMALNFVVDFLLLLGTNRLSGYPAGGKRCALAGMLGAIYSGCCMIPRLYFLGNLLWRTVSLLLMASIAFGWNSGALRRGTVFFLLSMALGGIALSLGRGNDTHLLLSAGVVWLLCRMGFGGAPGQSFVPVTISDRGQTLNLMALRDTGNTLRDPITGESVIVIGADAGERLTGLPAGAFSAPMETIVRNPGYRLIPYHAVGNPGGILLAKRYADVQVGSSRGTVLIAFAPENFGVGKNYQALAGGML